jgi:putative ABC transport system ATP-binding protein
MLNDTRGTTLIIVTHDQLLASRCHRYVELAGGEIINRVANDPVLAPAQA